MNQLCNELELALALGGWAAASAVARDIAIHLPRLQNALQNRSIHRAPRATGWRLGQHHFVVPYP